MRNRFLDNEIPTVVISNPLNIKEAILQIKFLINKGAYDNALRIIHSYELSFDTLKVHLEDNLVVQLTEFVKSIKS